MVDEVTPVLHKKLLPPAALSTVDWPGHTVEVPLIVAMIEGLTAMEALPELTMLHTPLLTTAR